MKNSLLIAAEQQLGYYWPSLDFFYFVVATFFLTIWRCNRFKYAFCSFVHAISKEVRLWRHFSLLVERGFCSFAWLNFWSHLIYLTLKNDFLTLKSTFLKAALIFSASSYSAPFFTTSNKKYLALPHFVAFSKFCVKFFVFSRLVSLFGLSARSHFKQQLLCQAVQNEESQYKKFHDRNRNGINP